MNVRNFSLVLALVVFSTSSVCQAQNDFFFSFADLGGPVANGNAVGDFAVGDTGSLYLYYSTNGPSNSDLNIGFFTDLLTSASGVVAFTAAETFDYNITVGGVPIGTRLNTGAGGGFAGPAVNVADDLVTDLRAFTVTGMGIIESNNGSGAFLDAGYSMAGDAFQIGRLDFSVIGEGSVDISYLITQAVNGPDDFSATAVSGIGTINVGGVVIPEPTSAGLLAMALVGLVARRRRS